MSATASATVALPARRAPERRGALRRLLKHPRLMHFHRLIALVVAVNAGVLGLHLNHGDWRIADGTALSALATLTLVNFAAAVLIRQQHVLNVLFGLAGRTSSTRPLWLRWTVSKVNHIGGIHVGAALAGTAWLCAFAATAAVARVREPASVSDTTLGLTAGLVAVVVAVVVCAAPAVRMRAHDVFELSHRFGGWTAVALFWALTLDLGATASSWRVWVLAVLTASIAAPWLRLRRVPVAVERPSGHAAVARLDYGVTPRIASGVAISRSPLGQWHSFATVRTPGRTGYRLLVSRAGDWTSAFVDDPPSHVWVRGVPTAAPMASVEVLFERIVYVATGSGIGPCLGQILAARVPARLVWSVRDPRTTYGDELVDEVQAAQPDAVIWDTTQRGKPDLLQLAARACHDFGAEAAFVVSNKAATWRVVHGLERMGIPAFGPIWDS